MGNSLGAKVVMNPGPSLLINRGAHSNVPSDLSVFASCVKKVGESIHPATLKHTTYS